MGIKLSAIFNLLLDLEILTSIDIATLLLERRIVVVVETVVPIVTVGFEAVPSLTPIGHQSALPVENFPNQSAILILAEFPVKYTPVTSILITELYLYIGHAL